MSEMEEELVEEIVKLAALHLGRVGVWPQTPFLRRLRMIVEWQLSMAPLTSETVALLREYKYQKYSEDGNNLIPALSVGTRKMYIDQYKVRSSDYSLIDGLMFASFKDFEMDTFQRLVKQEVLPVDEWGLWQKNEMGEGPNESRRTSLTELGVMW